MTLFAPDSSFFRLTGYRRTLYRVGRWRLLSRNPYAFCVHKMRGVPLFYMGVAGLAKAQLAAFFLPAPLFVITIGRTQLAFLRVYPNLIHDEVELVEIGRADCLQERYAAQASFLVLLFG